MHLHFIYIHKALMSIFVFYKSLTSILQFFKDFDVIVYSFFYQGSRRNLQLHFVFYPCGALHIHKKITFPLIRKK